jgi:hypothetical protein
MPLRFPKVKRRRRNGRLFAISFALTLVVLIGLVAALLLAPPSSTIPARKLPAALPSYPTAWARYVPSDILSVSVINYSLVRQLNSSAVPSDNLLDLLNPTENITAAMVNGLVIVSFSTPNATASIIYLTKASFLQIATPLEQTYSQYLTGKPAFYYASAKVGNQSQNGWLVLVPSNNIVAFAFGTSHAKQAINLCLEAANGTTSDLLQTTNIRQVLYILNGTENHLSFSIQKFPGLVSTGNLTALSVDYSGSSIHVSYVVGFRDASTAKSQESYMRDSYLSATTFAQYDQYLMALEYEPFSQLQFAIRLVG